MGRYCTISTYSSAIVTCDRHEEMRFSSVSRVSRADHDYEYIQIQYDYYGTITITIQLHCIHSLAVIRWLLRAPPVSCTAELA
jgi:hypothetical protein